MILHKLKSSHASEHFFPISALHRLVYTRAPHSELVRVSKSVAPSFHLDVIQVRILYISPPAQRTCKQANPDPFMLSI